MVKGVKDFYKIKERHLTPILFGVILLITANHFIQELGSFPMATLMKRFNNVRS